MLETFSVNAKRIAEETEKKVALQKLLSSLSSRRHILWFNLEDLLERFNLNQEEFKMRNIILRDHRIIIPKVLQKYILKELHTAHLGQKILRIAKGYY